MKKVMTKLLNLPGVIVEDSRETDEILIFSVKAETKTAICSNCGKSSHRLHQNHGHLVKDLPVGNRKVILKLNRRQFKCNLCQKPFSETLSFVAKRQSFTNRYAVMITKQVLEKIEEVSIDMSGNYKSLVQKICPNTEVTVDRFHVTKMIHEELNQARIDQKKTASALKAIEIVSQRYT